MHTLESWKGLPREYQVRPATMQDVQGVADVENACSLEIIGIKDTFPEDVQLSWKSPNFNLDQSTCLVFNQQDELIAFSEVWDTLNPPIHPVVWGRVKPDYRDQGLGSMMINWAIERSRQVIARVPQEARVSVYFVTRSVDKPTKALFEGFGMQCIRHSWQMIIDLNGTLPRPEWPQGISLRIYGDEIDTKTLYLAEEEAFRDHWGFVEEPFEDGYERWTHRMLHDEEYDPSLWFLAMEEDEIAGASLCRRRSWDDKESGWVGTLFVREAWRRRGIALALLHHSFREFQKRGKKSVGLGVDSQNLTGATKLYEKAGMRINRQFERYEYEIRAGKELRNQLPPED